MNVDDAARVILIAPGINWITVAILGYVWWGHRDVQTLTERFVTATILALLSTTAAFLGADRLGIIDLPDGSGIAILAVVLIGLTAPNLYWLTLLLAGGLREP